MYPVIRMAWQVFRHRNDPPISLFDIHESRHICWPWDIDIFWELNNGRALTLYDLGRVPAGARLGLIRALRENGWGLTVAGSSVRYRRRIRVFDRITMRTRALGWDERFFYIEQSMWRANGDCAGHVLIRSAATGDTGVVPPADLARAMGFDSASPILPVWVAAWAQADALRPWPPMQDRHDATSQVA